MRIGLITTFVILLLGSARSAREMTFHGMADASAAVFLDKDYFVVADDESNRLRIYQVAQADKPCSILDLNKFLQTDDEFPEADIEAAARAGDTIYWITSHGRNKDGKLRPSRYRFFATQIRYQEGDGKVFSALIPQGQPCRTLIDRFLKDPASAGLNLDAAVRKNEDLSKKEREKLAPKEKGLNIEAMAFVPDRGSLLIGLRNPLFKNRQAILFELINPSEVIEGKAARFGRVLLWDLGQRGLRGMEYDPSQKRVLILAGPVDSEMTSALFTWDGDFEHDPNKVFEWPPETPPFTPEGIAIHPADDTLWIASDDGTLEIPVQSPDQCREGELLESGNCPNKYLADDLQKTFRIRIFNPRDLNPEQKAGGTK